MGYRAPSCSIRPTRCAPGGACRCLTGSCARWSISSTTSGSPARCSCGRATASWCTRRRRAARRAGGCSPSPGSAAVPRTCCCSTSIPPRPARDSSPAAARCRRRRSGGMRRAGRRCARTLRAASFRGRDGRRCVCSTARAPARCVLCRSSSAAPPRSCAGRTSPCSVGSRRRWSRRSSTVRGRPTRRLCARAGARPEAKGDSRVSAGGSGAARTAPSPARRDDAARTSPGRRRQRR